jgi:hypothetical protein
MRIPAVAIAVAFCGGILLGRGLHLTHGVLGISFLGIFFLLIAGLLFAWRDKISAGEQNPYGHPSPELLERLRASGARILRTDEEGAVQVVTDGQSLRVNCFAGCPAETTVSGNVKAPDHDEGNQ